MQSIILTGASKKIVDDNVVTIKADSYSIKKEKNKLGWERKLHFCTKRKWRISFFNCLFKYITKRKMNGDKKWRKRRRICHRLGKEKNEMCFCKEKCN